MVLVGMLLAGCTSGHRDSSSSGSSIPAASSPTPVSPTGSASDGTAPIDVRWFSAGTAWYTPIPLDAPLAPTSPQVTLLLNAPDANRIANLVSYAVPVVEADPSLPARRLVITEEGEDRWGHNDLSDVGEVRIPADTTAAPGTDGKLVVIDRAAGRALDLLLVQLDDTTVTARWGGVYPLDGDGTSRKAVYQGPKPQAFPAAVSRGTGSGISSLAGLVTADDIRSGSIDHALVFATDRACGPPFDGPAWYPATTTDGWVTDEPCIPEGGRLQLDPLIDLDSIALSPGQRMVGEALQKYGAYCIDNGGSRVGFIFELAADPSVYAAAGLDGDYASMNELPWDGIRLLDPMVTSSNL